MKATLLHNWKAKLTSLLLAVAIWFLIDQTIEEPEKEVFPVPGTGPPAPIEPSTPIPGVPVGQIFPPACEEVVAMADHGVFFRLHWFESGDFAASLVEFPARVVL